VGQAVVERDIAREHPREAQQLKPVSVALERNREIRVDEMKAGVLVVIILVIVILQMT
jgi:hypothetical protein